MIKAILKRKRVIFITGDRRKEAKTFLKFVLQESFTVFAKKGIPEMRDFFSLLKNEIIIIEDSEADLIENTQNFLRSLSRGFIVVTEIEKKTRIKKILSSSLEESVLVLDFSISKKLNKRKKREILTFGVNKKNADFYVTDIVQKEEGINFKINYGGNTIPFWVHEKLKNKEIYSLLPAICIAKFFKLNLADVSLRIRENFNDEFTEN